MNSMLLLLQKGPYRRNEPPPLSDLAKRGRHRSFHQDGRPFLMPFFHVSSSGELFGFFFCVATWAQKLWVRVSESKWTFSSLFHTITSFLILSMISSFLFMLLIHSSMSCFNSSDFHAVLEMISVIFSPLLVWDWRHAHFVVAFRLQ